MVKSKNKVFFSKLEQINKNWKLVENIVEKNSQELLNLYNDYSKDINQKGIEVKRVKNIYSDKVIAFVIAHKDEFNGILTDHFNIRIDNFLKEVNKNLISKITRMNKIEKIKGKMTKENILENIEGAIKSGYYMHFRYLYNERVNLNISDEFFCAIFYFIREYCYASMFRYNSHGRFNVPYGGISYNRKNFSKKIEYLKSSEMLKYMQSTIIYNMDFEEFCTKIELKEDDFIFLDPPYDTEFSTYAKNEFGKNDQIRLAEFLKNTKSNFMLIIKNTDFIYSLYNDNKKFNVKSFDKKYLVSFQNRNDKNVEHLMITNY